MRELLSSTFALVLLVGLVCGLPDDAAAASVAAAGVQQADTTEARGMAALDHGDYAEWRTIDDEGLTRDGAWAYWTLEPPNDDDTELVVKRSDGTTSHRVERGQDPVASPDSRFVAFRIRPFRDSLEAAEEDDDAESPRDTLGVLDLASGEVARVPRLDAFELPEEEGARVAYTLEEPREAPDSVAEEGDAEEGSEDDSEGEDDREGADFVVRDLATGEEASYAHVTDFTFSERGDRLAFVVAPRPEDDAAADDTTVAEDTAAAEETAEGPEPGVYVAGPGALEAEPVLGGQGAYEAVTFDEEGLRLAFITDRDDRAREGDGSAAGEGDTESDEDEGAQEAPDDDAEDEEDRLWTLYAWDADREWAQLVADSSTAGLPEGWSVSPHAELSFSESGARLFFETHPVPDSGESEADEDEGGDEAPDGAYPPDPDEVEVDVWHWKDPYLQPMQKERVEQRRERDYLAVAFEDGGVVQLATERVPEVEVGSEGDADAAVGTSELPYRKLISWDWPQYRDVYVVDVRTGDAELVMEKTQASPALSPGSDFLYWYDNRERDWFVRDLETGAARNVTAEIDVPLWNEEHDRPYPPSPYGSPGWTEGDRELLVYDRYDVWVVDPEASAEPRRLTEGEGRRDSLRFRRIDLEPDEPAIPRDEPLLLASFDYDSKASGFHRDRVSGDDPPERLLFGDRSYGFEGKADDAEQVLYTRETFREFPDLRTADLSLEGGVRLSDANPQQADYRWGTAELVSWYSEDGTPLDGILYVPDDLDTSERHPMMVYFYERMSDWLHVHRVPAPGSSSISIPFYVSRGYVVFVPDIVYEVGYPGESALDAIVPGVLSVLDRGFVDPDRIGVQGHSWGGYQVAYMVTRTDLFAAAEAGAPVSNMTSAYGGIRWGTGMSRMFQYERTQSRLGASLWERRDRYIENSPLFWADRIETPLLMLHNDEDTAVPWYQGIELFVALRRLGKPAWLVNYNGEPHGVTDYESRVDWSVRMQQFFDHHLKGAPAPVWLAEGVPAVEKGETLGLDLIEDGADVDARTEEGG
ncbi:MAG: prolyl oligopeptidase family serine peptidase [Gemmatimonadota bacterium]